ncbi:ABC transporter permease [Viridibacillus sp. NPDC096237]|uniref:ABC transporter permease n=1 Tax=Viridibacillus sp. NPDC096237 TaxID=3390721 RepID=UPI003CFC9001
MIRLFQIELLKLRKSFIWWLTLVSPLLAAITGILSSIEHNEFSWLILMAYMFVAHSLLFLPLLTGVFAAFICRFEHIGDGWKQLLALPVGKSQVYIIKFMIVALLLAVTQGLFLSVLLVVGFMQGLTEPIPWNSLLLSIIGGWVACLPLLHCKCLYPSLGQVLQLH